MPGELHGDCGLGRSSETLPDVVFCATSGKRTLDGVSLGDGTDSLDALAVFKASKCDRREETGLWELVNKTGCV